MLSVLDRSNLGNARLAGLEDDIDLTGFRYNWLGTIFYIAYILSQWLLMVSSRRIYAFFETHDLSLRHWLTCILPPVGLETLPAAHLLRMCRLFLGLHRIDPGRGLQLEWFDGVQIFAWCR